MCLEFSLRFTLQLDALGVVNDAVEDGVRQGERDAQVLVRDWDLVGDQGRGVAVTG